MIVGSALRSHSDAGGTSAPASAVPGKGTTRARPRAHETRAEREEAHHGHQKKCQGGTTRAFTAALLRRPLTQITNTHIYAVARRTHARSWQRTSSARGDTSKSSTRCARNCRRSVCASRRCAVISKWPTPCAEPLVFVVPLSAPSPSPSCASCLAPPRSPLDANVTTLIGDEEHEPGAQPPADPAHHERV